DGRRRGRRVQLGTADDALGRSDLGVLGVHRIAFVRGQARPVVVLPVDQQCVLHVLLLRSLSSYDERAPAKSTARCKKVSAPVLSSISLRLPHLGLWTHDGQPSLHGQPRIIAAVSRTQPSNCSKPRSVIPTPPA